LRVATINLLGSEAEKVNFFIEFDLMDDLCSYYAANENWIQLYETHVEYGNVLEAVETVKEHNLVSEVEPETFKQVLNYAIVSSMWSRKGVLEVGFFDKAKQISEDFHDVIWIKDHFSEWKIVFGMLDVTMEDLGDPKAFEWMRMPADAILCNYGYLALVAFCFQKHLGVSTTRYLPREMLLRCGHLIGELTLHLSQSSPQNLTRNHTMNEAGSQAGNLTQISIQSPTQHQAGGSLWSSYQNRAQTSTQKLKTKNSEVAPLYLACGIYTLGRHEKGPLKQYWANYCSPVSEFDSDDTDDAIALRAITWAQDMFAHAMDLFDKSTRELNAQEFPRRCTPFLLRGLCMKNRTGDCRQLHERPNSEKCRQNLASLVIISSFYAEMTSIYQRKVMADSFQKQFLGRRRYWLQQLEDKMNFVTPLEQSGEVIMDTRYLLQRADHHCLAACLEDALLYRMKKHWYDIHTLTGILEQIQIAFSLGPGATTIFARTLMRKLTSIQLSRQLSSNHALIATKEALRALERVRRAAPRARQNLERTELVFLLESNHLLTCTLLITFLTGACPS
jgi:hypothetical protein